MLINVALPGATEITQMDESDLLKLEGSETNDMGTLHWTQYHLKTNGAMVHRSANIVVSPAAAGILANL